MTHYPCHQFEPCRECQGLGELANEIPSPIGLDPVLICDECAFQMYEAEKDLLSLL